MKSIKNHLSLLIPLFAIIFSTEYFTLINKILNIYEKNLNSEYSLIIVSDRNISISDLHQSDTLIKSVEAISVDKILNKIRQQINIKNINEIKEIIPSFYAIKLHHYSDMERIEKLKGNLMKIKGVRSVYAFENMHDKMYEILNFFKTNISIFIIIVVVISFMLIIKQMTIWQFEHYERMQIMALFGAPVWLRSTILIKLAIVDATLALLLMIIFLYIVFNQPFIVSMLFKFGIGNIVNFWTEDIFMLLTISYGVALVSTFLVIVRFKEH